MMWLYRILFAFLFIIGFSSCSTHEEWTEQEDEKPTHRTILVYVAAQNSLSNFAYDDLQEMLEGMKEVDENNHLLVYLDTEKKASLPSILHIYKDARSGQIAQETLFSYSEQDDSSVTVERMADVFRRAFKAYPAESYGLILWSHGDNWLPGDVDLRSFGQDGGSLGPVMEIADLEEAIAAGTNYLGENRRFDFIYFDACFMQGIEVAYQLRSYTDYLIGCPLETPGPGSPYEKILSPLFEQGEADVLGMAQLYYETYQSIYNGGIGGSNDNWTSGAAISVVRTDALEQLAAQTYSIYHKHADQIARLTQDDLSELQAFDNGRRYDGVYKHAYYDFGDYIRFLASEEEYTRWKQALDRALPYAESTPTCYSVYYNGWGGNMPIHAFSGLSTYVPVSDSYYADWNRAYQELYWTNAVY